jgi:hypothetical protein
VFTARYGRNLYIYIFQVFLYLKSHVMPQVVINSLSPRKHGLGLRSVYVRFWVHNVALGQALH